MQHDCTYVMRDQIRDRVRTIMAHDIRHPELRRRSPSSPVWLFGGLVVLNVLAAAMTV
jgi:hypothetical protein